MEADIVIIIILVYLNTKHAVWEYCFPDAICDPQSATTYSVKVVHNKVCHVTLSAINSSPDYPPHGAYYGTTRGNVMNWLSIFAPRVEY